MTRSARATAVVVAIMLFGGLAVPLAAAPASTENKFVYEFGPEDAASESELASDYCGFDVDVEVSGWFQEKGFNAGNGSRQHEFIAVYHIEATYSADDKTYELLDVGPDRGYTIGDTFYLTITGRSVSGSGVIGHVVINAETGEVELEAGRNLGFYLDAVCAALS